MARLHGAIERDPAQHERLIARVKEILARVARCRVLEGRSGVKRESVALLQVFITSVSQRAPVTDLMDPETPAPPHTLPRKKLHLGVSRLPTNEISTASL